MLIPTSTFFMRKFPWASWQVFTRLHRTARRHSREQVLHGDVLRRWHNLFSQLLEIAGLDPLEKILQSLGMKNLNFSQDQKKVLKNPCQRVQRMPLFFTFPVCSPRHVCQGVITSTDAFFGDDNLRTFTDQL